MENPSLSMLAAMLPALGKDSRELIPRRMIAARVDLGFLSEKFFPEKAGRGFELSPDLKHLKAFRNDLTVFSGVSQRERAFGVVIRDYSRGR